MKKILFDTDVLIELLRGNELVELHIQELITLQNILVYTSISEAEIYQGIRSHERAKTKMALGTLECLSVNQDVGKWAGEYLRKYSKSHGLEIADALIAAAAKIHRFALCTFNWKHYPMHDIERHMMNRSSP